MLTPLREANRLKVANVNSSTTKPSMERSLRTINLNKLNNTPDMKSSMPESKPKYPISLFDWKRLFPASPNNRTLLKSNHQKIDQNYVKVGHSFTNALKGIQEE